MKRSIVADLHNHTTVSDGALSPADLVRWAYDLGLQAVAITDHDTLAGLEQGLEQGRILGLEVITGIEVTLRFKRPFFVGSLHLLWYFKPELLTDTDFCKRVMSIVSQGRGPALVRDRVTAINQVFGPDGPEPVLNEALTVEQVMRYGDNITRRHFAQALEELHGLKDRDQVARLLGNDSPAYIPSGIDMSLISDLLRQTEILCVLAHPAAGSFPGESHYKEVLPPLEVVEQLLPEFLDPQVVGIAGLEVHYPGHTPELESILIEWAKRYNLVVTGGSDCHDRVRRPLGLAGLCSDEYNRFRQHLGLAE
ncbi:PHP domain-containing protein [bacterium]|nr:PHP domain-containing protein [bacterium]